MEHAHVELTPQRDPRTPNRRLTCEARAAIFVVLSVVALAPGGALASETSPPVAGSWTLAESADQERQRLEAIDDATSHLLSMLRGRARARLEERTTPPERLTLEIEGSKVTIGSQVRELELELGGSPIEVSGDQGKARLSATMEGDDLIVTVDGDTGGRTTRYQAEGDRLSVEVTMTGDNLAGPLTYVTTYTHGE